MKSHDLAQLLKEAPNLEVRAYDPDAGAYFGVTGMVYGDGYVDLQTDSDKEAV